MVTAITLLLQLLLLQVIMMTGFSLSASHFTVPSLTTTTTRLEKCSHLVIYVRSAPFIFDLLTSDDYYLYTTHTTSGWLGAGKLGVISSDGEGYGLFMWHTTERSHGGQQQDSELFGREHKTYNGV